MARPAPSDEELSDLVRRVGLARDGRAAQALLRRNPKLHHLRTVAYLSDAVAKVIHVDLDHAERLSTAAGWLAARVGDDHGRARAMRALGNVRFSRGKYAQALGLWDEAVDLFRSRGSEIEVGRTLSNSLQALIFLGRYEEASRRALVARGLLERAGDRVCLARLDSNLANLFYRQDRFPEALELYRRAYEQFLEQGGIHDVAAALRNMAVCYISLNQFDEALASHREARAFCEKHGLLLLVVGADYNVAYLHYLRGEYTKAIELYRLARERSEKLGDAYHRALCDLDQSELYLELNLIDEGVQLATEAFEGFEALKMGYEAAKALTNLAIGAGRQGEAFRALGLFGKAREMFVREGNDVWPALIDAYRALVLQHEGRLFEARQLGEAALGFFAKSALPSKAALCELLLARIHLRMGEFRSARELCLAALGRLGVADTPEQSYRAHFLLGQVEEALGDREAAFRAYRAAHARLENLRSHLEQDELKVGFLKDKLAVYESLVTLTLAGDRRGAALEQAFAYVEQAKSRSLADLLAFRAHALPSRAKARSGLVEEVHGLRQELNWYYRQIDIAEIRPGERSPEQIEALRQTSRDRETRLLRTLRDVMAKDEEFASLQVAGTIGLEAIRSTIPDGATLVEYYEARGTILACVLTRQRLEIVPVTLASRVRHLLRLLQFQLSKFRLGPDHVRTFGAALLEAAQQHLRELHAELFAPIRDLIQGGHVIVVPHDFLHYVPFHALHDGHRFVIEDLVVSYAPSASVHHLCATKRPAYHEESLILGVPDPATPFILDEVRAVAATLPRARMLLGEEATEENLRRYGPKSRFVHIATHGLFRYDNPMFSSLQLGDSRLSLFDIYQLELRAELVTLSGCGTGLNVVEGGDELMGLVRGLLYAGAQAALVTLWDVSDQSTAEFMKRFYRRLQAGTGKAVAVREAMLDLRRDYPHPYYWAPFVLVGQTEKNDPTPISIGPSPHPI